MQAFDNANETLLGQYPLPENEIAQLNTDIAPIGWVLDESEGTYYIAENGDWLLSYFGRHLPDDWNMFLNQRKSETVERFSEDAGMLITWDALRQRIIFWLI